MTVLPNIDELIIIPNKTFELFFGIVLSHGLLKCSGDIFDYLVDIDIKVNSRIVKIINRIKFPSEMTANSFFVYITVRAFFLLNRFVIISQVY